MEYKDSEVSLLLLFNLNIDESNKKHPFLQKLFDIVLVPLSKSSIDLTQINPMEESQEKELNHST